MVQAVVVQLIMSPAVELAVMLLEVVLVEPQCAEMEPTELSILVAAVALVEMERTEATAVAES
jgi:hypothetical protein